MKRFTTLLLASLLLAALAPGAHAASIAMAEGTIISMDAANSAVTVNTKGRGEVVFLLSPSTALLDNSDGKPLSLSSLKAGMAFTAWHSEAMTRSLPPQANLFAMIVTLDAEKAFGYEFRVGSVEKDGDGSLRLLNEAGDLYVTVSKDAQVDLLTANGLSPIKVRDLTPGSRLIAWFEFVLTSYPGQARTDRVLALSLGDSEAAPYIPETGSRETGPLGLALLGAAAVSAGAALPRRKEED